MESSNTAITKGVKVTVKVIFREDISEVESYTYFYNYEIRMENCNDFPVQLLTRNWYIFDSLDEINLVSGEGVVGQQPILKPGESFVYVSGCELTSDFGYMKGSYTFKNLETGIYFSVIIPVFHLSYPPRLN